jgi:hypothetical protein
MRKLGIPYRVHRQKFAGNQFWMVLGKTVALAGWAAGAGAQLMRSIDSVNFHIPAPGLSTNRPVGETRLVTSLFSSRMPSRFPARIYLKLPW